MSTIQNKLGALENAEHKLLLIVGQPGTGKSKLIHQYSEDTGTPILDLNPIFGEEVPEGSDSQYIKDFMKQFLATYKPEVLLLDNKRVLYSKNSQIDLLEFLKEIATTKTVVATWNGMVEDGNLVHIRSKADTNLTYPIDTIDCEYILCE